MTAPSTSPEFAVMVIGAGPIGLTLANLLGRYGVPTLLVERNPTTVQEPRAVSIDDESLRTLQSAGLVEEVLTQVVPGYGSRYLDPAGNCFLEVLPTEEIYGFARRNAFRQPILEAQLLAGISRFSSVSTLFEWRLSHFRQDEGGVQAALLGPGGAERVVRCAYLVGCDGASSTVRNQLGLTLRGETFSEQWLIVDLEDSPAPGRDTMVFCDARRPAIALPGPDATRRFEFKLLKGESPQSILQPDVVDQLLREHGAAPEGRITRTAVYTFHARLAATWQVGRVFLAGDACHLTPPFAGQGMNSGIRDAHNLAWKLAAVWRGALGPRLLETYERERRDHVAEMIKLALRMGRIMGPPSRLVGAVTQLAFRALRICAPARDYFALMKYKPKPRFRDGFLVPDQQGGRRTCVGRLLPQPKVRSGGEVILLDELLGDGFALLGLTENLSRFAEIARGGPWGRLGSRAVALTSSPRHAAEDIVVAHADPAVVARLRGNHTDLILFVRPDRYVAAAFRLSDADETAALVEALCGLGPAASSGDAARSRAARAPAAYAWS